MASRASLTQSGQSESVCRGQPRVGFVFSQDFRSGLSDHFVVKDGFGLRLLKNWIASKVTPAALQIAASTARITCVPTRYGINLYPLNFKNHNLIFAAFIRGPPDHREEHDDCPRAS